MSAPRQSARFAARPGSPDAWVKASEPDASQVKADHYDARLTVDITTALRGRIKVAAFSRGLTVADMLRALLEHEFGESCGPLP
jgi:hypothetical protein